MKKTILIFFLILSCQVFADQKATLSCNGSRIILVEKSPYLGEDSKFSQSLFILKFKEFDESAYTAFFLNITREYLSDGRIAINGSNEVGGKFYLIINKPKDVSDGTTIKELSVGKISYNHGPLKGFEPVDCITQ